MHYFKIDSRTRWNIGYGLLEIKIEILIDSLTNCLICTETGEECNTEYCLAAKTIAKREAVQLKEEGWKFDWSIPHKNREEECRRKITFIVTEKLF